MIKITNGYTDFCIPYNEKQDVMMEILNEMVSVGFRNVAIEQTHKHETISAKISGKSGDQIPLPVKLDELAEKIKGKLNLYNRLTIIYSDPSVSHVIARSQNIKKFHIVAALPTSDAALQHACQTFQGDIITYNPDTIRIRLSRKFYYVAIRRNMFFELKYSPVIIDSTVRKRTISRAQQYHMVGKSKAIIISSEATDSFHIRSPYDISGLGLIFGLSEEQAKCAISTMCRKVFVSAESRRLGRSPVVMKYQDVDTSTSEEEDEEMKDDGKEDEDEGMEVEGSSNDSRKRKEITPKGTSRKKLKTS